MSFEICILKTDDFKKFIDKLDNNSKARLVRDIDFLRENGSNLKMPFAKKIDKQLWELRTSGKQRVRIIYSIKGKQIYIINWFIKKTQKIPTKELNTALKRLTNI